MDYRQKYLKYKQKYINLQKNVGGANPHNISCITRDIFDLDCILPLTKNEQDDYIFKKRLSRETINYIRSEIQDYYEYFYNYLMFPNLEIDKLKTRDLRDEIIIPVINREQNINNEELSVGIVNYDIIIQKLKNIKIIEKAQEINNIKIALQKVLKSYKDYVVTIKQYTEFNISDNDIINLDSYEDIRILPSDNIYDYIYKHYENKYNEYKKGIETYNNLVRLFNNSTALEQKKIDENMNKTETEYEKALSDSDNYLKILNEIQDYKNNLNEQRRKLIEYNISNEEMNIIIDLINYNNTNDIMSMIEEKKKNVCKNILDKFNKNPELNCQILSVSLTFFDSNINKLNRDKIGHANSVTIYRFQKDGEDHYLCLRTEPHRHTNIYCRNSVRKAIRDIFKYLHNSHYLDFIIDSKEGLQVNEEEDIQKQNLTDFDNIPQNIQNLSPLQGNSGFCASWTIYTLFVLMTNRNLNLENLGKYFANFNLRNPEKQTISKFKSELDKCYLHDKKDSSCKSKDIFEKEFKKYIDYDSGTGRYYIPNETQQKNYSYILTKQIKLYRMIIFVFYFITKKLKISELFDNTQNENDKKIINEIFNKFDTIKILDILNDKLEFQNKLKITITQDVLDKDTHLCDDNMFDHKEFCNINDIVKSIPNPDNYNCNINKLKENNNIRLRGLQSTLNEEKTQTDSIIKDINYIFQKL